MASHGENSIRKKQKKNLDLLQKPIFKTFFKIGFCNKSKFFFCFLRIEFSPWLAIRFGLIPNNHSLKACQFLYQLCQSFDRDFKRRSKIDWNWFIIMLRCQNNTF